MADARTSREAMRVQLLEAFTRHHRRRAAERQAALLVTLLLAAGAAWSVTGRPAGRGPQVAAAPAFHVQLVRGSPRSGLVQAIDDDELLRRLEEIGRPAGLVRIEGRTMLTGPIPAGPQPAPAL